MTAKPWVLTDPDKPPRDRSTKIAATRSALYGIFTFLDMTFCLEVVDSGAVQLHPPD